MGVTLAKTWRGLFLKVTAFENLFAAYRKARLGKRWREDVATFDFHLETNLWALKEELDGGTYRPGSYESFFVFEPKRRLVSKAPFRDRVVHHALVNVLEPLYEPTFIFDSYACRKDKGTHRAIDRCQEHVKRYRYCLKGDLVKFFPSVDHQVMLSILATKILDARLMDLLARILDGGKDVLESEYPMHFFPGDDLLACCRPRGLPIGNLTSQFLSNVLLNELDRFVKGELRARAYVRYGDDFLLFADDKRSLHAARDGIAARLEPLRLLLHPRKTQVMTARDGIAFLGFRIFPHRRKLLRNNIAIATARCRALSRAYARGEVDVGKVSASVLSWVAHAKHGHTRAIRRNVLTHLRLRREAARASA